MLIAASLHVPTGGAGMAESYFGGCDSWRDFARSGNRVVVGIDFSGPFRCAVTRYCAAAPILGPMTFGTGPSGLGLRFCSAPRSAPGRFDNG